MSCWITCADQLHTLLLEVSHHEVTAGYILYHIPLVSPIGSEALPPKMRLVGGRLQIQWDSSGNFMINGFWDHSSTAVMISGLQTVRKSSSTWKLRETCGHIQNAIFNEADCASWQPATSCSDLIACDCSTSQYFL